MDRAGNKSFRVTLILLLYLKDRNSTTVAYFGSMFISFILKSQKVVFCVELYHLCWGFKNNSLYVDLIAYSYRDVETGL